MKTYTYDEVNVFIKELETGRDEIQNKISGLREKQKSLKLLDFKGKQEIDKEIEDLTFNSTCHNYSILMLQLYEDSIKPNRGSMEDKKLIQCEKEAEAGNGISKLIIFCHKCFVEHTIVDHDLKRLEMEAIQVHISCSGIICSLQIRLRNMFNKCMLLQEHY